MTSAPGPEPLALATPQDVYTRADWEKAAAVVLRKARRLPKEAPDSSVWEVLTRTTLDGIAVPPLGTVDTVRELPPTGVPGAAPFTRGRLPDRPESGWDIRSHVGGLPPAEADEVALLDLAGGVTSLWVGLGGPLTATDLGAALEGVRLGLAPVVLDAPADPLGAARAFAALVTDSGVIPAEGTNLGADPIGARVRGDHLGDTGDTEVAETVCAVAEVARSTGTLALVVDGTAVHDLGASDGQELGYSLAVGAAYLRALTAAGMPIDEALELVEFRYAATDEQFPTIAKFRAARRLWARVADLSGAGPAAGGQRQHAVTSRPMMSTLDPYVNMLRTTVAAFAAGVGGADAVTVLPFDTPLGLPEPFGRRIARNTSSVLIAESHVAAVSDAAGGSYAVELLTDGLARAAWAEFGRIEEAGGIEAALADGSALGRVGQVAAKRADEIARRTRPLTGISEFPNLAETRPTRRPDPVSPSVARYGAAFEALRDDPVQTPVFLATLGSIAAHTARASFATNLFAAGGIPVVTAGPTDGVDSLLAAYDGAPVVCLCGTDAAYAAWGTEAVAALRAAGATWVVLAGKPGSRTLDAGLVDDSAAAGVDALSLLARTREKLT
ncbi:MAG: methylmalonyl-CoA mutase family protein [Micrococcales bacterium]|nr:methylmalonyl-CoA mutase family protein [Micrococcales bacterium]